jgi:hypothetical protein
LNYITNYNKRILGYFIVCFIIHAILSVYLGNLKGWGGDEWFSYREFTIMGAPFAILTKIQIYFLGPLSKHNFILFKMQGLVWLAILFLFLLKMYSFTKDTDTKYFILFTILFITLNPFLIEQTQFFRYYNLYTLSAFSVYFLIRQRGDDFGKNRKLFYGVLAISPFSHLFLFWSLFVFLFFKEVTILIRKRRWIIFGLFSILIIVIALNFELLLVNSWNTLMHNYDYASLNNIQHRGVSLGTFIKPIHAIFVYLFGVEVLPLEDMVLNMLFIVLGVSLIFILLKLYKENFQLTLNFLFCGILPFLSLYLILDPLTLPGMTQAEPKHALFIMPWLIFLLYKLNSYRFGKTINVLLFSSFLYADYLMITKDYPNWNKVEQTINSNKISVITDTPLDLRTNINNDNIIWFQDTLRVENALQNNDTICIVMQGWGNYQALSLEQKWNSAKGTSVAFGILEQLFKNIENSKFHLTDAYSRFPLHCMVFVKNNAISHQSIPWLFDIKYRDLKFPLIIDNQRIIGFEKIENGEEVLIDSSFYYFTQTVDPNEDGFVIEITNVNDSKKKYRLDEENDVYRSNYCRSINQDSVAYTIKKRPLVSNSLRYPGSMFNSQLQLYKYNNLGKYKSIRVINEKIILYLAIIDD